MADSTQIAWTDSTFNPWWGCTKIAPGCDNCYAAAFDKRIGGKHWENQPRTMSEAYWQKPLRWHQQVQATGLMHKVFCGSMCDWTDNNAPAGQLVRLWDTIRLTPDLDWQLLTKRAVNIKKRLPSDWDEGYDNVWLGVTVENCKHGLKRLEILKTIPAYIRFISVEPLLECLGPVDLNGIDWVIVGGESGPHARPMNKDWVYSLQRQCHEQNTPFFFKQWGGTSRDKGGDLINGQQYKNWPENIYTDFGAYQ